MLHAFVNGIALNGIALNGIALVYSFSVVIDSDVLKEEDQLFQL